MHGEIAAGTFLSRPEEPRTAGPRPQPPALVSINCMRLSASGQVAGRILDGLAVASSGEHAASVSGKPLVYGVGLVIACRMALRADQVLVSQG